MFDFIQLFQVFMECNVALESCLEVQRCTPRESEKLVFPTESSCPQDDPEGWVIDSGHGATGPVKGSRASLPGRKSRTLAAPEASLGDARNLFLELLPP